MKCMILIAVLAALVACNDAAAVLTSDTIQGTLLPGDVVLHRNNYQRPAATNQQQIEFVNYNGNFLTTITHIVVRHVGQANGAQSSISRGGIGWNNVQIILQSPRGSGFNYDVTIYGR